MQLFLRNSTMTKLKSKQLFPIFLIWASSLPLLVDNSNCSENNTHFSMESDLNNSTITISKVGQYLLENRNRRINIDKIMNPNQSQNVSELQINLPQSKKDRIFGVDSNKFQAYLKSIDLSVISGYREDEDLENWIPPEEIQRDLPSYISGFDYENRPIWVFEYAKYDYSKYANAGKRVQALFKKYFRYKEYIALKSHVLRSTTEHPVTKHNVIVDFEGFTPEQILNPKAFQLQLSWIKDGRRFSDRFAHKIIAINVNQVSENIFTFARSVILSLSDRIEVYGTNKANWGPQLLKNFPQDQIPEWYGGSKGFKPLYVVG